MSAVTGSVTDPEFRRRRAKHAAQSRTTLDYHVEQVVSRAPALTAEQVDRLRTLLPAPAVEAGDVNAA